jgi:hypothetical protein
MTLAEEIRAEFARIRRRFEGCDLASLRMSSFEKIEAYVTDLEDRVAAMPQEPESFDVVSQINRSEARGSVNSEFARRVARGVL